jgi:transposase
MAAVRDKDTYLAAFFRRVAACRGGQLAMVAIMHKLAIAIWHVLTDRAPHRELNVTYFTQRNPERTIRRIVKEASSLGLTVRFDPIETATV